MNLLTGALYFLTEVILLSASEKSFIDDICGRINGQRIYLEHGEAGTLVAKYDNNIFDDFSSEKTNIQKRCNVEFISCPSCIIKIRFKFLNTSRNCGKSTVSENCGCDYVWIYEPTFEQSSEQFCGRIVEDNISSLEYKSQTRKVVVAFLYNRNYEHAFTLDYYSESNKLILIGYPKFGNMNNGTQIISSPFFPNLYPLDLSMEHIIRCESQNETCRISLIFTDFLIAPSSIIDLFDWNGERMYITTGNIFRPPVITTSGPSLTIRFYANGVTNYGYKAFYTFKLGHVSDIQLKPNIDCGGHVNNLGGGITMMNMVHEGLKLFNCIWLIKPPETYFHMKTHLYVKVVTFSGFDNVLFYFTSTGSTDLTIRQGLTSNGAVLEKLKISLTHFPSSKEREHVVPISQGFYIGLNGVFYPESRLALVYAAFNYKNCLAGSDFLCHNRRCISTLLNCDGFDHCGDNSDEFSSTCSTDPRDRRHWSQIPNFLFPKVERLSDLTTSTLILLLCTFGLIGFIFAVIILLYRINLKTQHQRQIQNHIETINSILEEGAGEMEEEIIIPDDPPDYDAPPDYDEVVKMCSESKVKNSKKCNSLRRSRIKHFITNKSIMSERNNIIQGTSHSGPATSVYIPDSPPPAYVDQNTGKNILNFIKKDPCFKSNQKYKIFEIFKRHLLLSASKQEMGNYIYESFNLVGKNRNTSKIYFSDSELANHLSSLTDHISFYTNTTDRVKFSKIKKSFTTGDINTFI